MLRSYFIVAFRTFSKQKAYSLLNISGLAIGLAGAFLIYTHIIDELRYDTTHPFHKNTYRLGTHYVPDDGNERKLSSAPALWSGQLKEQFPGVKSIMRSIWVGFPYSIHYKDKDRIVLTEELFLVDNSFREVLYFDVIAGNRETALQDVHSIALSESTAKKIFGFENPIGKILSVKHMYGTEGQELNLAVTAVFRDYPSNSSYQPSYLVPMGSLRPIWDNYDDMFTGWLRGFMVSYVVFEEGADVEQIKKEFGELVDENLDEESGQFIPILTHIHDVHFDDEVKWHNEGGGDITHLHIFGSIALFLIIIASINYMNLATARSSKRSREVGMRKVMGSSRYQLIFQFIQESFLTTLLSLFLSLILVLLALPVFNTLAQKNFTFGDFFDIWLLAGLGIILFFVSILAGSYPAFYLSKFNPVEVLKGGKLNIRGSNPLRQILVIFQFSISLFMLICSGVLMNQIHLMKNSKLNEQGQQILCIRYGGGIAPIEKYPVYRNSVLEDPKFNEVTIGNHLPRLDYFGWIGVTLKIPELSEKDYEWKQLNVDFTFPEVFNLELLSGRDFILESPADSDACLINEAAVRNLGIDMHEALGLRLEHPNEERMTTVIGVVKDFPYESIHHTIDPLRICGRLHPSNQIMYVKLPGKNIQECIQSLETKWKQIFPGIGFDYWFLDDEFNRMYESEMRMSGLSESFSVIAIFIACLGLIGLASYMAEQKNKEISIRKVMGASAEQILILFLSIFLKMLAISILIAVPLGYFLMNKWLQQFVYRTSVDWITILTAVGIVSGITLITVSYELIRASAANPVKAIQHV